MPTTSPTRPQGGLTPGSSAPALTLAGVAALLASSCCVLPLVLAVAGISGAWIGQLRRLAPYSSWLLALALASLGVAAWRLYRSQGHAAPACGAGDALCRTVHASGRRWFWLVAALTAIPLVVPLMAPWFY